MVDLGKLRRHSLEKLLLDTALQDYESVLIVAQDRNLSGVLNLEKDIVVDKLSRDFRNRNYGEDMLISVHPERADIFTHQKWPVSRDENKECESSIDSEKPQLRL